MKKYWPIVLLAAFFAIGAHISLQDRWGRLVPRAEVWTAIDDRHVPASTSIVSEAYDISQTVYHGVWWQCDQNNGTIKLEVEQAGASIAAEFAECEDDACADIEEEETGTSAHIKSLWLSPMQYLRIKLTETGGSGSAYCTVKVYVAGGG